MKTPSNVEKRRYWQDQVRKSRAHRGSMASYCRRAGIPVSALSYWRKKLAQEVDRTGHDNSPFVAVRIAESAPPAAGSSAVPRLPDPKWVAQLILQLHQGGLQ